ncbi:PREDICTED: MADS-box transcription factor PHERES 2-like [Camelina sativa]|uniref:MADS-box transcription factor PHERES 2-like n=1 Tax=Camelina sativa TaxID=90675 RepID=A0ABM0ZBY9_CAMSA|nr:PREDICTED: MADS-box transcription factor PHERES 2-like [Camelina sativa]
MRKKVKLSLIENATTRRKTFLKRKEGLLKKVDELATLCDVKACAVVYSPYQSTPEVWPSREGVEEVVSNFMECSVRERTKNMVDQETFVRQSIAKENEHLNKLREENRNSQIKEFMFGCLEGKMEAHHLDGRDKRDLKSFVDKYLNVITHKIEILTKNGESSSSLPPLIADAAAPINLNQNPNVEEHEDILSMENNHQEPVTARLAALTIADADVSAPNNTKKL